MILNFDKNFLIVIITTFNYRVIKFNANDLLENIYEMDRDIVFLVLCNLRNKTKFGLINVII